MRCKDEESAQILGQLLNRVADRLGDFIGEGSILDVSVMHLRHKADETGDPVQPAKASIMWEIRRNTEKPSRNLVGGSR
jgi:hypothetical protein